MEFSIYFRTRLFYFILGILIKINLFIIGNLKKKLRKLIIYLIFIIFFIFI